MIAWCTESISPVPCISIRTESHCVYRCDDSRMVHHVSNTDTNVLKNARTAVMMKSNCYCMMDIEIDANHLYSKRCHLFRPKQMILIGSLIFWLCLTYRGDAINVALYIIHIDFNFMHAHCTCTLASQHLVSIQQFNPIYITRSGIISKLLW